MQYSINRSTETGDANLSVFVDGELLTTDQSNPNWDEILEWVLDPTELFSEDVDYFKDMFRLDVAVRNKLAEATTEVNGVATPLSERVSVKNGVVYIDNDPIHGAIANQITRFLDDRVSAWEPLVNFLENIMANPIAHSREQLYDWLVRHEFSLADDGCFYAYKGVTQELKSINCGPGIVNGLSVDGQLDNSVGNIVELPRSVVAHDPAKGCAAGLHAGTYSYASTFGHGATLRVKINPRDVVSVPTDCNWQKIRCCRYEVVEIVDREDNPPVYKPRVDRDWQETDW